MTVATPRNAAAKRRGDTCVARMTVATPQDTAAQRRGDTCVARKTVATPQLAGNIARAGPRQMRQRARSKLLVTTDTDEKAMHAADTPGVSISPHTGKSAPAARGMPTAL